jgi:hypothetical protein
MFEGVSVYTTLVVAIEEALRQIDAALADRAANSGTLSVEQRKALIHKGTHA